ncbi:MAG: twin-arginine translocase TatA/TatE family subunit [Deltaproteobacteria bacterium]|nr:twin-arginine translocase TatA/TatE family subunit [Deltaproteobacteria bacterium]
MFGIGIGELLLIAVIALIVMGPEKMPEMVKSAAKVFNEFKKAGREVRVSLLELEKEASVGVDGPGKGEAARKVEKEGDEAGGR